ncbi:MAG: c-type cytochrome [Pseudobdellovibrionaceae bacterium]|nr:c-type cytochrome [Bdellovibrionales bacterium]USN47823.1 MAG: c-type cytochrome [Pseudobdellovibrionaceae bacterium]
MKTHLTLLPSLLIALFIAPLTSEASAPLPKKPPIPKDNPMTPLKVELGKQLYFDPRLSKTGTVSCNSCHNVMSAGVDNTAVSTGILGLKGGRNSPTVWNAAFLSTQFWDGRAKSLEEQAIGPLVNPVEMGMPNHDAVVARIKEIPGYVAQFKKVFKGEDSVTIDNFAKAVAAYERTLITPNASFDKFIKGRKRALSDAAQAGWKTFQEVGCTSCHQGAAFAGPDLPEGQGFFMKFPTFADNSYVKTYKLMDDTGRHDATKNEADKHMWRVPTLRNIALTAPYFHNGSVKTLDEAVRVMAKTQLNRDLNEDEVTNVVAFLNSLTGQFPKQTMPRLPDYPNGSIVD